MTRHIQTEIRIQASPEQVWRVLTDFSAYPQWNPFIVSLRGRAEPGERLSMRIRMPEDARHEFTPVVLQATPPRRLRWLGRLGVPGLFDGEHGFELGADGAGTLLCQTESFQGFLVPFLWRGLELATRIGFESMNLALKARAEAGAPGR